MKKLLLFILLPFITVTSYGQFIWQIDFEDTTTLPRVYIDTASNPNNIWQIGQPNKTLFTSANSNPNAIVTDLINPYPINDTSSFTIIHIAQDGWAHGYPKVDIGGYYFVNSDTLVDYGYIDYSADLGITWNRADSTEGYCTWGAVEDLPTFSGNSNGWKHFYYCLQVPTTVDYGDTILYRFTFISDSVQTNKDGLMFDDLHFEDWAEGIAVIQNDNLIAIAPNPSADELHLSVKQAAPDERIQVLSCTGQLLMDQPLSGSGVINTSGLSNGMYLLKYSDSRHYAVKKFIVQR